MPRQNVKSVASVVPMAAPIHLVEMRVQAITYPVGRADLLVVVVGYALPHQNLIPRFAQLAAVIA
jgi:hypothetical protein